MTNPFAQPAPAQPAWPTPAAPPPAWPTQPAELAGVGAVWGQQPAVPAPAWGNAPAAPNGQRAYGKAQSGTDGVRTAGLRDRLLLVTPTRQTEVEREVDDDKTGGKIKVKKTRVIADVVVLDGPPVFTWRDANDPEIVHTIDKDPSGQPFNQADPQRGIPVGVLIDFWFEGAAITPQLTPCLPVPGRPQPPFPSVLGRLIKLPPVGNRKGAWKLDSANLSPTDIATADAYIDNRPAFG